MTEFNIVDKVDAEDGCYSSESVMIASGTQATVTEIVEASTNPRCYSYIFVTRYGEYIDEAWSKKY